jgi:hypothetical protein
MYIWMYVCGVPEDGTFIGNVLRRCRAAQMHMQRRTPGGETVIMLCNVVGTMRMLTSQCRWRKINFRRRTCPGT